MVQKILIAHRGNINGKFEHYENEPTYIDMAIKEGYDVEVDIWYKDNTIWLGHDKPTYGINMRFLRDRIDKLWIHCKNKEAMILLNSTGYGFNYFWHQNDDITLTSKQFMWVYPDKQPVENSIAVLPELYNADTSQCRGICSDFIAKYKT